MEIRSKFVRVGVNSNRLPGGQAYSAHLQTSANLRFCLEMCFSPVFFVFYNLQISNVVFLGNCWPLSESSQVHWQRTCFYTRINTPVFSCLCCSSLQTPQHSPLECLLQRKVVGSTQELQGEKGWPVSGMKSDWVILTFPLALPLWNMTLGSAHAFLGWCYTWLAMLQ